jgi:hypothetical protein
MTGSQQSARSRPLEGYMGNCMQRHSIFTMVFVGSNGIGRVLALVGQSGELGSELEYSFDLQIRLRVKGTHHVLKHGHKGSLSVHGIDSRQIFRIGKAG